MDDSEARHMIDQFNNYASWSTKDLELIYAESSLGIGISIIILTFYVAIGVFSSIPKLLSGIWFVAIIISAGYTSFRAHLETGKAKNQIKSNREKLIELESYRAQYRSLPDNLTLDKIIQLCFQDLKKLLNEDKKEG